MTVLINLCGVQFLFHQKWFTLKSSSFKCIIFQMCCILTYFPNKINASISLEVTKWKICCNNWTWKSADWLIDWQKVVFFSFVLSVSQISSFLATFYYVRSAICQVKYLLSVQKDLREKIIVWNNSVILILIKHWRSEKNKKRFLGGFWSWRLFLSLLIKWKWKWNGNHETKFLRHS